MEDWKTLSKKIWHFLWEDNSIWSWIANVAVAFLLIKFLVYPGIGLAFGTKFPVVAVISSSMDHHYLPLPPAGNSEGIPYVLCDAEKVFPTRMINFGHRTSTTEFWEACGAFYEQQGISQSQFDDYPFRNGFRKGDIMVLIGRKPEQLHVGDVIVFASSLRPEPIIHRVIAIDGEEQRFQTKGDHNAESFPFEQHIYPQMIYGKAVLRIPLLGYVKILAVDALSAVLGLVR